MASPACQNLVAWLDNRLSRHPDRAGGFISRKLWPRALKPDGSYVTLEEPDVDVLPSTAWYEEDVLTEVKDLIEKKVAKESKAIRDAIDTAVQYRQDTEGADDKEVRQAIYMDIVNAGLFLAGIGREGMLFGANAVEALSTVSTRPPQSRGAVQPAHDSNQGLKVGENSTMDRRVEVKFSGLSDGKDGGSTGGHDVPTSDGDVAVTVVRYAGSKRKQRSWDVLPLAKKRQKLVHTVVFAAGVQYSMTSILLARHLCEKGPVFRQKDKNTAPRTTPMASFTLRDARRDVRPSVGSQIFPGSEEDDIDRKFAFSARPLRKCLRADTMVSRQRFEQDIGFANEFRPKTKYNTPEPFLSPEGVILKTGKKFLSQSEIMKTIGKYSGAA